MRAWAGTKFVVEPSPSSPIRDWLQDRLDQCGFDGSYTSRCVLNIIDRHHCYNRNDMHSATGTLIGADLSDSFSKSPVTIRTSSGQFSTGSLDVWAEQQIDCKQEMDAVIEMLRCMVSPEEWEVHSETLQNVVAELFIKLRQQQSTDVETALEQLTDTEPVVDCDTSASQDPASRYYEAFPSLSDQCDQLASANASFDSEWSRVAQKQPSKPDNLQLKTGSQQALGELENQFFLVRGQAVTLGRALSRTHRDRGRHSRHSRDKLRRKQFCRMDPWSTNYTTEHYFTWQNALPSYMMGSVQPLYSACWVNLDEAVQPQTEVEQGDVTSALSYKDKFSDLTCNVWNKPSYDVEFSCSSSQNVADKQSSQNVRSSKAVPCKQETNSTTLPVDMNSANPHCCGNLPPALLKEVQTCSSSSAVSSPLFDIAVSCTATCNSDSEDSVGHSDSLLGCQPLDPAFWPILRSKRLFMSKESAAEIEEVPLNQHVDCCIETLSSSYQSSLLSVRDIDPLGDIIDDKIGWRSAADTIDEVYRVCSALMKSQPSVFNCLESWKLAESSLLPCRNSSWNGADIARAICDHGMTLSLLDSETIRQIWQPTAGCDFEESRDAASALKLRLDEETSQCMNEYPENSEGTTCGCNKADSICVSKSETPTRLSSVLLTSSCIEETGGLWTLGNEHLGKLKSSGRRHPQQQLNLATWNSCLYSFPSVDPDVISVVTRRECKDAGFIAEKHNVAALWEPRKISEEASSASGVKSVTMFDGDVMCYNQRSSTPKDQHVETQLDNLMLNLDINVSSDSMSSGAYLGNCEAVNSCDVQISDADSMWHGGQRGQCMKDSPVGDLKLKNPLQPLDENSSHVIEVADSLDVVGVISEVIAGSADIQYEQECGQQLSESIDNNDKLCRIDSEIMLHPSAHTIWGCSSSSNLSDDDLAVNVLVGCENLASKTHSGNFRAPSDENVVGNSFASEESNEEAEVKTSSTCSDIVFSDSSFGSTTADSLVTDSSVFCSPVFVEASLINSVEDELDPDCSVKSVLEPCKLYASQNRDCLGFDGSAQHEVVWVPSDEISILPPSGDLALVDNINKCKNSVQESYKMQPCSTGSVFMPSANTAFCDDIPQRLPHVTSEPLGFDAPRTLVVRHLSDSMFPRLLTTADGLLTVKISQSHQFRPIDSPLSNDSEQDTGSIQSNTVASERTSLNGASSVLDSSVIFNLTDDNVVIETGAIYQKYVSASDFSSSASSANSCRNLDSDRPSGTFYPRFRVISECEKAAQTGSSFSECNSYKPFREMVLQLSRDYDADYTDSPCSELAPHKKHLLTLSSSDIERSGVIPHQLSHIWNVPGDMASNKSHSDVESSAWYGTAVWCLRNTGEDTCHTVDEDQLSSNVTLNDLSEPCASYISGGFPLFADEKETIWCPVAEDQLSTITGHHPHHGEVLLQDGIAAANSSSIQDVTQSAGNEFKSVLGLGDNVWSDVGLTGGDSQHTSSSLATSPVSESLKAIWNKPVSCLADSLDETPNESDNGESLDDLSKQTNEGKQLVPVNVHTTALQDIAGSKFNPHVVTDTSVEHKLLPYVAGDECWSAQLSSKCRELFDQAAIKQNENLAEPVIAVSSSMMSYIGASQLKSPIAVCGDVWCCQSVSPVTANTGILKCEQMPTAGEIWTCQPVAMNQGTNLVPAAGGEINMLNFIKMISPVMDQTTSKCVSGHTLQSFVATTAGAVVRPLDIWI